ncbi:tetratricopeptide repeat protein [Pseudoalteromonas luteoviolacea]|uniref:tetratricopeptide repeat protein n=1 Tax=Pseudoalteromonas luteoviolacea TaxID=43657 RepID=UPI0011536CDC|nr:tetratricopeptide repeat protein [Pseudoalteromonas luteoviolacea]TQF67370.1 tetratricopeptide repeat protein [Pseudoalteromonas luteoviolacea]
MKVIKNLLVLSVSAVAVNAAITLTSLVPEVSIATAYAETKTKRVPALREKVYSQLARAQKLADEGNVQEGLEVLDSIKDRASSMNSYEVAMMHNFYGFIYYNENDLVNAIASFEKVVAEEAIPESLKLSTTFSLAQLAMANGDYAKTVEYLDDWKKLNTQPIKSNFYTLKAQALYQNKDYKEALENINSAIGLSESKGEIPKENWLVLQRALYYSLNQPDNVINTIEKMVKLFDKPQYWIQLGGMYGEVGEESKQLAILETAKQRGFIKTKTEILQLSQVYLYNGLPFKAAQTLKSGVDSKIIEHSAKNLSFIAEAYVQAKDDKKSIEFFEAADKMVDHGNFQQRLAEVYINMENYDDAADAARNALDKGSLSFESNAYVALGMAQYNLKNFDASILAFEQAEKHKKSAKLARQWIKYVQKEKLHEESLKQATL